jgi:hypothetical protein
MTSSGVFRNFEQDEDGGLTIFGLYIFVSMAIMAGVAIDVAHLISARTHMQVAADLAGHTALYRRDTESAAESINSAIDLVEQTMPVSSYGVVLTAADINFGSWDITNQVFTSDPDSREAVMVTTSRNNLKSNAVGSFLLQFAGLGSWDMVNQSVFTTFRPACFREGFVAEGVVDIQSNNGFSNGFCIHSNEHVSLNSNNTFEAGTVVSMPDTSDIDLPNSGWESNTGLAAALRSGAYRLRIINKLPDIMAELTFFGSEWMPSYITNSTIHNVNGKNLRAADFRQNRINILNCTGGKTSIRAGQVLRNMVIVTSCEVTLGNGVLLEDRILATTHTGAKSINSPQGLQIGKDDNCATGGGVQILTMGSMNFAANLQLYGGQLIANGNIYFTANAEGIEGASMIAGGEISGTSNMTMGFCGTGMENNFEAEYFRLAI